VFYTLCTFLALGRARTEFGSIRHSRASVSCGHTWLLTCTACSPVAACSAHSCLLALTLWVGPRREATRGSTWGAQRNLGATAGARSVFLPYLSAGAGGASTFPPIDLFNQLPVVSGGNAQHPADPVPGGAPGAPDPGGGGALSERSKTLRPVHQARVVF
jgi:hypothetical protein